MASQTLYDNMIAKGIAKESARFVLPESARTRFYMSGTIRSWIHYVILRVQHDTQAEHRSIAEMAHAILVTNVPTLHDLMQEAIEERAKTI